MEWISVKDRLPEDGQMVDVWQGEIFNSRAIDVYFLEGDTWQGFYETDTLDGGVPYVTHWMKVEPPKQHEGKVLVPIEPSEEMIEAGKVSYIEGDPPMWEPSAVCHAKRIYKAMISTAIAIEEGKAND